MDPLVLIIDEATVRKECSSFQSISGQNYRLFRKLQLPTDSFFKQIHLCLLQIGSNLLGAAFAIQSGF
jgi:hypothetical protein